MGRRLLLAAAARAAAVCFFLAAALPVFGAGVGFAVDFFSGVSGPCWEDTAELLSGPHKPASASSHHHLRTNRPTLIFFALERESRNLFVEMPELRKETLRPEPTTHGAEAPFLKS
jgi:hypothetical protein